MAVALAPVDETGAKRLIGSLRGAPLILGTRGRPPLDIAAASAALVAISKVAAGYPAIAEIEVNPLLVCRTGAYGLTCASCSTRISPMHPSCHRQHPEVVGSRRAPKHLYRRR